MWLDAILDGPGGGLRETEDRLEVIPGIVPNLIGLPPGCRFASRCRARETHGLTICEKLEPELVEIEPAHAVRCWLYQDGEDHTAPLRPA